MIRFVVADEDPVFRFGLLAVPNGAVRIMAQGDAEDGAQQPDVLGVAPQMLCR